MFAIIFHSQCVGMFSSISAVNFTQLVLMFHQLTSTWKWNKMFAWPSYCYFAFYEKVTLTQIAWWCYYCFHKFQHPTILLLPTAEIKRNNISVASNSITSCKLVNCFNDRQHGNLTSLQIFPFKEGAYVKDKDDSITSEGANNSSPS